jgi:hypothetical protein
MRQFPAIGRTADIESPGRSRGVVCTPAAREAPRLMTDLESRPGKVLSKFVNMAQRC